MVRCFFLLFLSDLALYCAVLYIAACVDVSRMVFRDRSFASENLPNMHIIVFLLFCIGLAQ